MLRFDCVEACEAPYRHWIVENVAPSALACTAIADVPGDDWPHWVRYRNDCEAKRTSRDLDRLPVAICDLVHMLNHPACVESLSRLTGIEGLTADPTLHGAGLHITDAGGHLNCHLDYARHPELPLERRLSLVLFLNDSWSEEEGGAFELYDDGARNVMKRVWPDFNTAIIFENGDASYHGTQAVSSLAPPRVTVTSYYLAPPRPGCNRRRALFVPARGT